MKSQEPMTIEQRRTRIERAAGRTVPLPRKTRVRTVNAGGVPSEIVMVQRSRSDVTVLYLHGGAFCLGSPRTHRALVARICSHSAARALVPDYRLAPEHPFPAALKDVLAVIHWLYDSGVAPDSLVIAGDSAGGNLALSALIALRDAGDPLPAAAVCLSPPTDLRGSGASFLDRAALDPMLKVESVLPMRQAYIPDEECSNPLASPLLADLHGLPPLLIQVGSYEILYDDSVRFAQKASDAGVEVCLEVWDKLWHVFHSAAPYVPEANRAIRRIGRFIRAHAGEESRKKSMECLDGGAAP
jgi:monoterpene epsilon-lactone hydrolase